MQLGNLLDGNIISIQETINNFGKKPIEILKDIAGGDLREGTTTFYKDQEYVVFDTETKGFSDEIIEIGAVIVKNNKIQALDGNFYDYEYYMKNNGSNISKMYMFAYFVKPKILEIPKVITDLTHIDLQMILDGEKEGAVPPNKTLPNFTEALIQFMRFCGNRPLIAHNAKFDTGIFSWSVWNNSIEINNAIKNGETSLDEISAFFTLPVIDTLRDAKKILKINPQINHRNSTVAELFGLPANENMLHRAYYDVIFSTRVFYGLYETAYSTLQGLDLKVEIEK